MLNTLFLCYSAIFLTAVHLSVGMRSPFGGEEVPGHHPCNDVCGQSVVPHYMIINGLPVDDNRKYPWIVSIHTDNNDYGWGSCAGTLISVRTVVTAAHCMYTPELGIRLNPEEVKVGVLGEGSDRPDKKYEVEEILVHPGHNLQTKDNDIALIKLKEETPCSEYTRPLCISSFDHAMVGDEVIVVGWGLVGADPPEEGGVLREGTANIVDNGICMIFDAHRKDKFCTLYSHNPPCVGDSGAPGFLFIHGKYHLVGVVSGGGPVCDEEDPVYFTRASKYYTFMRKNL